MTESVEEVVELSLLYDYYGELLSESKRRIFENYAFNDLSLSEIADIEGMTRQGVHETVKKCISQLKTYEEKLSLIKNKDKIAGKLNDLEILIKKGMTDSAPALDIIDTIRQEI